MDADKRNLWVQANTGRTRDVLQIMPEEWEGAYRAINSYLASDPKLRMEFFAALPNKLSKKYLQQLAPTQGIAPQLFQHDFVVVQKEFFPGYTLAAIARSKIYIDSQGQQTSEGVLGFGGTRVAKVIQWQDGSIDVIKIGPYNPSNQVEIEKIILAKLGHFKAEFTRTRPNYTNWIGGQQKIKDKLYTVQSYHPGIELDSYFTTHNISSMNAVQRQIIAYYAARAIDELHRQNILHCDIKPANFIMNIEGTNAVIVPIDYNISIILNPGELIRASTPSGTFGYTAPEILSQGFFSRASDVYALGSMFKRDLKFDEMGLKELTDMMTHAHPELRPSMEAVLSILANMITATQNASPTSQQYSELALLQSTQESPTSSGSQVEPMDVGEQELTTPSTADTESMDSEEHGGYST